MKKRFLFETTIFLILISNSVFSQLGTPPTGPGGPACWPPPMYSC